LVNVFPRYLDYITKFKFYLDNYRIKNKLNNLLNTIKIKVLKSVKKGTKNSKYKLKKGYVPSEM